jgi:rubrerythrin
MYPFEWNRYQVGSFDMQTELAELLETAMYREIASQAVYEAGQEQTTDPGARALMKELAADEKQHTEILRELKDRGWKPGEWHRDKIQDLKISEHLTAPDKLEGATLQDTLAFAIKREQEAMEFYSKMMGSFRSEEAKQLCERLVHEELKHKRKLETLYDDLFYEED